MSKTVFLHIGFGKTGTSAVQEFFFHNRMCFLRQGLCYPSVGLTPYAHHGLALFQQPEMPPGVENLYHGVIEEINASPASRVLISSEGFCFLKPAYIAKVRALLAPYDVKIIFYVRNQTRLVESTYLEWQKAGLDYQKSIGNFFKVASKAFDFEVRLEPWIKEFGQENIIARVYDRRAIGEDTSLDMMKLLGLERTPDIGHVNLRSNPSILPEFSEFVTKMDEAGVDPEHRKKLIAELLSLSQRFKAHANHSLVSEEFKRDIREHYRESNARFASRYLTESEAGIILAN